MPTLPTPPPTELMRLLDGYVTTQLLYVAAKLGVADLLAGGSMSGSEIAEAVGADRHALVRVLRGLVIEDVLAEDEVGRFSLTPVGACLTPLQGAALVRGELYFACAGGLLDTVLGKGPAFEAAYGEPFFEHLARHPDHEAIFQRSMTGRSRQEADDVVAAYDFTGLGNVVDVGGGGGVLLAAILSAAPHARGVVLDREAIIPTAEAYLRTASVADRATCVAGDFFAAVPAGADAYVLSRVLHDWDDDDAVKILTTCRRAMTPTSRLLVVEAVMPERAGDRPAAIRMDLHMLLLFGARERTEAEFRQLLHHSGFRLQRVVMTPSPAGLGVLEATAA